MIQTISGTIIIARKLEAKEAFGTLLVVVVLDICVLILATGNAFQFAFIHSTFPAHICLVISESPTGQLSHTVMPMDHRTCGESDV
jgi:hypothetical protein